MKHGAWILEASGHAVPTDCVEALLAQLPQDTILWRRMHARYEVQIRLGVFFAGWNRDFDLSPRALVMMSNLGAHLVVDIYAEPEV